MSGEGEAERAERLAAALRANLARRKQQARGRKETSAPEARQPSGAAPLPDTPRRPDDEA